MNRPGQPPQRPPSLGPNPAMGGGPFRGPYPSFAIPPRTVMPQYPGMQNHRGAQNMVSQPTPGFMQQQQRGQNAFSFGPGLQQQQQQPHTSQTPLPHTPLPPQGQQTQQQQQTNNATPSLPPHLAQNNLSSLATAPSTSSASEVGLDPNDFPALGSIPTSNLNTPSAANTTSYATQAGTAVGGASNTGHVGNGAANQQRDFTPDDFPALGGQTPASQQPPPTDGHPPGLNGFQSSNDQQHRQTLLGSLAGGQQQPGLLNLGRAGGSLAGFQSDAEKRNYAMKLNQTNMGAFASNGTHLPSSQQQQPPTAQAQHLGAPPGVPPPAPFSQAPSQQTQAPQPPTQGVQPPPVAQQQQPPVTPGGIPTQHTPYVGNGTVAGDTALHPSQASAQPASAVPQTPAQQVLMSPADKWGLLGLLALIKSPDLDTSLLSVGTDLGTMGLDMQNPGSLYSTFITPWADSSAAHTVEPDFHLPACYNVQPPPPGPSKAVAFSDETLFFMFYSSPRDAMQELAAQELWNRNWRYHKEMRLWITKETGTSPSQKVPGGERGSYSYWDPENWEKARKEMTVIYSDLEEKSHPVFVQSQTLQLATPGATVAGTTSAQPQQQAPTQPSQPGPMVGGRVSAFQGMGMAAM
ncbi:hypothetical protein BXZ70DRAFT_956790 [Cristinia sonorae]|uniref:NOT2/NOT3/NOT5 C-terminal domain-containing protein n=1 Tax=Cristinia sonorae TaxID=1940300 RepID=A0A8K0XKZ7_9AGAR|nr:hypothetical protein BXZ70DRAFT_956790 [Cristinia sonorae]